MRKYEWKSYIIFSIYVVLSLILIWILASWVNIIMHNETDCNYWVFNFFNIFYRR